MEIIIATQQNTIKQDSFAVPSVCKQQTYFFIPLFEIENYAFFSISFNVELKNVTLWISFFKSIFG